MTNLQSAATVPGIFGNQGMGGQMVGQYCQPVMQQPIMAVPHQQQFLGNQMTPQWQDRALAAVETRVVCYTCGQEGHKSYQCQLRNQQGYGGGRGHGGRGRGGESRTFHPQAGGILGGIPGGRFQGGGGRGGFGVVTVLCVTSPDTVHLSAHWWPRQG